MHRRAFLGTLGLIAVPFTAQAQPVARIARLGYLNLDLAASPHMREAFLQGLRDLGYVEGRNLAIEYRDAKGKFERLPALAAELVQLKVDVIVATPTPPAVAAKKATRTVPIVMINAGDPVRLGLVASLAHPGGNVTGLSFGVGLAIVSKGLELLRETVPNARRVAVLSNPANPSHPPTMTEVTATARSLGLRLQPLEARDPNDFERAFAAMASARAEALLVVPDALFVLHRARLADLAATNRLPTMHGLRENVDAGGLISYGPNAVANFRRAAFFVDRVLRGVKPADPPVEQPTKFELVVNLKAAKSLGLTIPPSLLQRADQVIE